MTDGAAHSVSMPGGSDAEEQKAAAVEAALDINAFLRGVVLCAAAEQVSGRGPLKRLLAELLDGTGVGVENVYVDIRGGLDGVVFRLGGDAPFGTVVFHLGGDASFGTTVWVDVAGLMLR